MGHLQCWAAQCRRCWLVVEFSTSPQTIEYPPLHHTNTHKGGEMQTRNKSRKTLPSNDEEDLTKQSCSGNKNDDSETLADVSKGAVKRLLKRVKRHKSRDLSEEDNSYLCQMDSRAKERDSEETARVDGGCGSRDVDTNPLSGSGSKDELDGVEWEDGSVLNVTSNGVTVEFDVSPDDSKRKPIRRATVEEKELAELVHKVNLLCLLGRGRLIDCACNDPLIQASLLSILPAHLHKITEVPKLTAKALTPVVNWFHNNFRVRGPGSTEKPPHLSLPSVIEAREGTAEVVAALSVALFRALNLTARFVAILDVVPLKPKVDKPEPSSRVTGKAGRGIFNTSTLMVSGSSISPTSPLTTLAPNEKDNGSETSIVSKKKGKAKKSMDQVPINKNLSTGDVVVEPSNSVRQDGMSDALLAAETVGLKRKGDIEFEMQLEMAIAATAVENSKTTGESDSVDVHDTQSNMCPPSKKMKLVSKGDSTSVISTAIGSRKVGAPLYWAEVYCSGENLTGKWVHVDTVNVIVDGEQKVEAAAAACRKSLRYVVAFAGNGAKDVTRRYCMKWYKIASQRVDENWWDSLLAPLKQLESLATGGFIHLDQEASTAKRKIGFPQGVDDKICVPESTCSSAKSEKETLEHYPVKKHAKTSFPATRSSLEDMELQTRALTEPLPTNQQAYRNHHLYVLDRWLNKYQILHPKEPILGFCSGHPVYPRTCVQTLHSKTRWMREACQVKAGELPAKILKCSLKQNKEPADEEGEVVEGDHMALYGKWQTEPLNLPCAVNGIVPRNERGQVDVWSEKCLPSGTVHLKLPRVALVAKRLEIDYAPAMVGFESRNGRSLPLFEGIVVCAEFKAAILEAYNEEAERRMADEKRRDEAQALSRWYQLLSSIITRQRLNNCYGNESSQEASAGIQKPDVPSSADVSGNEKSRRDHRPQQDKSKGKKPIAPQFVPSEDHEHLFLPDDDDAYDEESSMRTKRCQCGFSIQVEEL